MIRHLLLCPAIPSQGETIADCRLTIIKYLIMSQMPGSQ